MDRTAALWAMVLFLTASLVFIGGRRLSEDLGVGVTALVQLGTLGLIVGVVVLVVRRMR